MNGLTNEDMRLVKVYAECDMNAKEVGRQLYMTHPTVLYRLRKIRDKTGLDPTRFIDLVRLAEPYWTEGWVPVTVEGRKLFVCPTCNASGNPWWVACPVCGEELRAKDATD